MKMGKKKTVKPLFDSEGKDSLLPGRHPCLCEASKHSLIANCLSCGRIVCEQEGAGDCFTCGTFVFTKSERQELLNGDEQSKQKIQQMLEAGMKLDSGIDQTSNPKLSMKSISSLFGVREKESSDNNLNRAIEHKNKLLEYDAGSVARSKVYDDQVDYFTLQNQSFVTPEAREQIRKQVNYLQENKFNKEQKLVIDFENLQLSDRFDSVVEDIDAEHRKLLELSSSARQDYELKESNVLLEDQDNRNKLPLPVYIPSENESSKPSKSSVLKFSNEDANLKIQGWELAKIEDRGMCLAMAQPYASLLVAGIKRFEGRSWYSPFRGRLWIYANAKVTLTDIQTVESFYRHLGHGKFPSAYPTACIVGCVTIVDCLPLQTYRQQYPEAEIESPYAFICEYPIALERPVPVKNGGGSKIYKIDSNVHKACKDVLGF